MLIPLVADKNVFGVLFAGWRRGSPHEHARTCDVEHAQPLLLEDGNRIARDINDVVLQRLFAAGLRLKTAHGKCQDQQVQQALTGAVQDLDEINEEIRSAIFRIRPGEASE